MASVPKDTGKLRPLDLGFLILVGLLTSGSSCSLVVSDGAATGAATGAAAGIGLAVFAAGGIVYCVVETEDCFPDREAIKARAEAHKRAQARFATGLRLDQVGDPAGFALICRSAQDGYAIGQYFYGSRLLRRDPARRAEALAWLRRAAAQNHGPAAVLLLREAGPPTDGLTEVSGEAALPDEAACGDADPARAALFPARHPGS